MFLKISRIRNEMFVGAAVWLNWRIMSVSLLNQFSQITSTVCKGSFEIFEGFVCIIIRTVSGPNTSWCKFKLLKFLLNNEQEFK